MLTAPWVIFDGDNTLWHVEQLYDQAREKLVQYLVSFGIEPALADQTQRKIDVELFAVYGYSPRRFEEGFALTLHRLLPARTDTLSETHVRHLARAVFAASPAPDPAAEEVVRTLAKTMRLGLITAGEREIQRAKLRHFHLAPYFNATAVVRRKDAATFARFCRLHQVDIARSWVIGDSLRSDIIPALDVGLNVLWYRSRNWHDFENTLPPAGLAVGEIHDLHEAIRIIADSAIPAQI